MGYVNKITRETPKKLTAKKDSDNVLMINKENKKLINRFLMYCKGTGKAETTLLTYENNLNIFFVWVLEYCDNKDFVHVKKNDFLMFQSHLIDSDLSPNRIKVLRATVSSLCNFIETMLDEEEKWKGFTNFVLKIKGVKIENTREKSVFEDDRIQDLLDMLVTQKKYQHACALALAWSSGARVSELPRFKCSFIKEENIVLNEFYKTTEKIRTKGDGKTGKLLIKYLIVEKIKPYFDLWMEERERLGVPSDLDFILIKQNENGEWVQMPVSVLKIWALQFGQILGEAFYFHAMRHNWTTQLAKEGYPAQIIQLLCGWASADMVMVYDDRDADDIIGAFFENKNK